jgi:copper(I)-binding protein
VSRNSCRAILVAGIFAVAPLVSACSTGRHPETMLPSQLSEGINASVHQVDIRNAFILGPEPGRRLAAGDSAPLYAWFVNHASSPDRLLAVEAPGVAESVEIAGGALDLPPGKLVSTAQNAVMPVPGATTSGTPSPAATSHRTPAPGATAHRTPSPAATATRSATGTPAPGASSSAPPASGAPTSGMPVPTPSAAGQNPSRVILKVLKREFTGGESVRLTLHFQQAGAITMTLPVEPRQSYYATFAPAPGGASTPATTPSAPATPATNKTPGTIKKPGATPAGAPKSGRPKTISPRPTA